MPWTLGMPMDLGRAIGIGGFVADDPIILLDNLHLTLESAAGAVNILRGIDLAVAAGDTVGVIGPSGSGKSTMLAVIAGLEQATSGAVRVAGHDLTRLSEDRLALFRRDNVGIVFQSFHLVATMTALENVAVPLELAGRADAFGAAADELAAVGLDHRVGHYPAELSGGEQQRVALARAVVNGPKLVLADEPTGNLDRDTGRAIIDLLFAQRDRHGTTLVLITHDDTLTERCRRIVRIADGRIADSGLELAAEGHADPGHAEPDRADPDRADPGRAAAGA